MPADAPEPAPKPDSIPQLDNLEDVPGATGGTGTGDLSGAGGAGGLEIPADPAAGGAPAGGTPTP
jgi:hypothetical protein